MSYDDSAHRRIMELLRIGEEIDADLAQTKPGLVKTIVDFARREAADAILAMIDADPEDAKEIRRLQNIVKRQQELPDWINQIWKHSKDEAVRIVQADTRELQEMYRMPSTVDMENDE
jgi:hypothetical protein